MKAKWRLEECRKWQDLTADEKTRQRLREITCTEVEGVVRGKVDRCRTLVQAAIACGLETNAAAAFDLDNDREATLARAYFAGAERGMRVGKIAARRMIMEAREFARLQLANNAPWLVEAVPEEDGE